MLTRLLRLLVPLTPRRCPRLFLTLRRGRSQTGLFRSRPLHPNPSPRPRTQPPPRRPAVPSQPQPSSPTRQKIRPKLSLASPNPLGDSGWREIAPPSPPPNSRRPAQALSPIRSPQPPLAVPLRTPQPPAQPSPHRPGKASPTHATPRSARRRPCPGASPLHPKNAPPNLKSFLEKTLTRASPPHFMPQPARPAAPPRRATTRMMAIRHLWPEAAVPPFRIELRSDTQTTPTEEMREAMARAEVGDDQAGEDPTVRELEDLAAELFRKEAALFVTSGTMGNLVSLLTLTNRGDSLLVDPESHVTLAEAGGFATLAGCSVIPIQTPGWLTPEDIEPYITPVTTHSLNPGNHLDREHAQSTRRRGLGPRRHARSSRHWPAGTDCGCTSMALGYSMPPRRWMCRWRTWSTAPTPCSFVSPRDLARPSDR